MSGTARDQERWWSEVNAKGITAVLYPTLWLTPFLSVVLVGRSIASKFNLPQEAGYPMAVIVEMLGVTTGHNLIEAKGWRQQLLAGGLFATYVCTVSAFIVMADGWEGLVFPALSVVAILTANSQLQRQLRRDAAARPAKTGADTADAGAKTGKVSRAKRQLPPGERVKAYRLAHPDANQQQAADDLGIPRSTVGYHWRQAGAKPEGS